MRVSKDGGHRCSAILRDAALRGAPQDEGRRTQFIAFGSQSEICGNAISSVMMNTSQAEEPVAAAIDRLQRDRLPVAVATT